MYSMDNKTNEVILVATILKPDKTVKITVGNEILTIKQKIIPDSLVATKNVCSWVQKGQKMKPCAKLNNGTGKPRGITIHNTNDIKVSSNTTPAEQYTRATYDGNMGGVVVHFYIYEKEIWQTLDETERGWHATDSHSRTTAHGGASYDTIGGNVDTIAIECIGKSATSEDTTAKVTAYLCKKYDLKPNVDVYTHNYFYSKKYCPEYILPHWDKFLSNVRKYYNGEIKFDKPKETKNDTNGDKNNKSKFDVQITYKSGINVRAKASVLSKRVDTLGYGGIYTISKVQGNWGYLENGLGWICINNMFVKKV